MGLSPLSPNQGPPNAAITVAGTGLGKKTNLQVLVDGVVKASPRASNQGNFSATVYAPAGSDRSVPIVVKQQTTASGWQQVLPTLYFALKNVALPPPPDTTPPVISNVVTSSLGQNGITVAWDTNEAATGQIQFGTVASGAFGSSTPAVPAATHQSQIITGLTANTDYQYRIKAIDTAGNQAALVTRTFKTLAVPPVAPTMSNVQVLSFDQDSAIIAWDLSENCTGQIEYGETTALGSFGPFENSFIYNHHEMELTGLTPGKKYYFKPRSQAQNGLWAAPPTGLSFTTQSDVAPPPPNVTYPMERPALQYVALPSIPSLLAYLTPYTDPTWSTKITRISSQAGYRHDYSRIPAWNTDETLICLGYTSPARILDGTTYAELRTIAREPMMMWSNKDPNKLFSCRGNKLQVHNATTGAFSTFHAFSGYVDGSHSDPDIGTVPNISIGHYEGGIDDNDEWIALLGWTGSAYHLITFNLLTNEIHDIVAPAGIGDCQISRKGNYVTFTCNAGTQRLPRNLSGSPLTLHSSQAHGDNALDINGVEVFVTGAADGSYPASFRLTDGFKTVLFPGQGYTYFQAGHASGRNLKRNGYATFSNYDETFYGNNPILAGKDQIVNVKLDGSGAVEVFGFARHIYDNSDPNLRYRNEVQATVSPRGNRVIYASNWRNATSEPHCFVASAV